MTVLERAFGSQTWRAPQFLVAISLAVAASGYAEPLDHWHLRSPLPTCNSLRSVVFAAGQFVAVGSAGTVVTSPDGLSWTLATNLTGQTLNAVAYGAGLFVAVADAGEIYTSSDATNWTFRSSGATRSLKGVVFGSDLFVAVGDGGTILTSQDGVNWLPSSSGVQDDLAEVAYGNGHFVAVSSSSGTILASGDGLSWQAHVYCGSNIQPGLIAFAGPARVAFGNGRFLVLAQVWAGLIDPGIQRATFVSTDGSSWTNGVTGFGSSLSVSGAFFFSEGFFMLDDPTHPYPGQMPHYLVSSDGVNWGALTVTGNPQGITGTFSNGRFVIVGGYGSIFASPDRTNWTSRTQAQGSAYALEGIASGNDAYVAVGRYTGILLSSGGAPFVSQAPSATQYSLRDVVFWGGGFTVVGDYLAFQSPDGVEWIARDFGYLDKGLRRVASGNGQLIAVGTGGLIKTSPTGATWTGRWSGTDLPLYGVAYGGGMYVVVGSNGAILTSPDSILWTAQDSGVLTILLDVAYGSSGFVAVGEGGTILSSKDGIVWSAQNSGVANNLTSVCYGNGYYLVTGGVAATYGQPIPILTSLDAVHWTSRNSANTECGYLGSTFANDRFTVVGENGVVMDSDPVTQIPLTLSLRKSEEGTQISITSPPGLNLRLQGTSDMSPSDWFDLASFTNVAPVTEWTDTSPHTVQFYRVVSP